MSSQAEFAYAKTRLHARLSRRMAEHEWRQLDIPDFARLTQLLQGPGTDDLLMTGIGPKASAESIESALRGAFRREVERTSEWHGPALARAVDWVARLPDLPAVRHFLRYGQLPAGFHDDPVLSPLAESEAVTSATALLGTEFEPLIDERDTEGDLLERWRDHWHRLLADAGVEVFREKDALEGILEEARAAARDRAETPLAIAIHAREELLRLFRRQVAGPGTVFVYLGIFWADTVRLRALLLSRRLGMPGGGP